MPKTISESVSITKAFAWFLAALTMVALLSPTGATQDEYFHLSSIWCARGIRAPNCVEFEKIEGSKAIFARTNLDGRICQGSYKAPLLCPTDGSGTSASLTNNGLYPPTYYFILSWAVLPSAELSVFLVRFISALVIVVALATVFRYLPDRHRVVLLLIILTAFGSTGYFLFASINPSSWTAFGVGVGWIAVHASLAPGQLTRSRRLVLAVLGILISGMAIGSREDAPAFLALAALLVCAHVLLLRYRRHGRTVLAMAMLVAVILGVLLELASPLQPSYFFRELYTYAPGEPDNVAFFSHNLLSSPTYAVNALGTIPSMTRVPLPDVIGVLGVLVLGLFIVLCHKRGSRIQITFAAITLSAIWITIMSQVASVDARDIGGVEPRYVYPLLLLAVGWWFMLGPEDLNSKAGPHFKSASIVAVGCFSLMTFTIAERYTDGQTLGLRYIPDGPDNWWWTSMPIGPNVVVVFASVFLVKFFREVSKIFLVVPSETRVPE